MSKHVKQARYNIQVVKCKDPICCKPYETNWDTAFPERFIPPPAVYKHGSKGLQIVEPSEYFKNTKDYKFATLQERLIFNLKSKEACLTKNGRNSRPMPFDSFCPSMKDKLDECVCKICGAYWPSAAAKNRHLKAHGKIETFEDKIEYDDVKDEFEEEAMSESDTMPVFENMRIHLASPFEWLNDEIA